MSPRRLHASQAKSHNAAKPQASQVRLSAFFAFCAFSVFGFEGSERGYEDHGEPQSGSAQTRPQEAYYPNG